MSHSLAGADEAALRKASHAARAAARRLQRMRFFATIQTALIQEVRLAAAPFVRSARTTTFAPFDCLAMTAHSAARASSARPCFECTYCKAGLE